MRLEACIFCHFFLHLQTEGFAPIQCDQVDERLGSFDDVKAISEDYPVMFDFMVNHISRSSLYYRDFQKNKDESPYRDFSYGIRISGKRGANSRTGYLIYKRKPERLY